MKTSALIVVSDIVALLALAILLMGLLRSCIA
jgi:hypothetical protein